MTARDPLPSEITAPDDLRIASFVEGTTLLLLVLVAVPLRHLGGLREATAVMGPIHGVAFLVYAWLLLRTGASGRIAWRDVVILGLAAFVPFGAFLVLRHRARAASPSSVPE